MFTSEEFELLQKAMMIMETKARYSSEPMASPTFVKNYCINKIGAEEYENFLVLYLDNQNRLIESRIESTGTIDQASVYPRNIAKTCLDLNASAVILSHNHPSGKMVASQADIRITDRIKSALDLFEIRVLDHVIVCANDALSFAEEGIL